MEGDQKPLIYFISEVSVIWSSSTLPIEVKESRVQPCPVRKSYFNRVHRSRPCPFRPTALPLHLGIVIVHSALPLLTTAALGPFFAAAGAGAGAGAAGAERCRRGCRDARLNSYFHRFLFPLLFLLLLGVFLLPALLIATASAVASAASWTAVAFANQNRAK